MAGSLVVVVMMACQQRWGGGVGGFADVAGLPGSSFCGACLGRGDGRWDTGGE